MNKEEFEEYSKTEWPKIREKLEALAKKNCWETELFKDIFVSDSWSICIRNNNRCVVGGFIVLGYIKLMFVDTATHDEGKFVVGAGERAVVAAHVETYGSFATGLHPHKNAVEPGEVLTAGLAVTQENLDTHIRVGVAFLQFVVHDNGRICTGKLYSRGTAICRVRLGNDIRIVVQVQRFNHI